MSLLSVITPVYNGANFISRCYNDLLDQTHTDWEWIVVDDGSNDGTAEEVNIISDKRVKLVSYRTNMGRGFARKSALDECQGDWMVVWDVDDLHFSERLEKINAARLSGYDFFCSYAVVCTNDLTIKGIRGFALSANGLPSSFVHPTMACRLDIAKKIGYDSTVRTGEDAEILWLLSSNYNGLWCKNALTIYQEDREVNLLKAIDSNLGHLKLLRKIVKSKGLQLNMKDYAYVCCKYMFKVVLLNFMKVRPELYMKSVARRSYGEVDPLHALSEEQHNYIKTMKEKFVR